MERRAVEREPEAPPAWLLLALALVALGALLPLLFLVQL